MPMRVHVVKDSELELLGAEPLEKGYVLCIYEGTTDNDWWGYIAASAGWDGTGLMPGDPKDKYAIALVDWLVGKEKLEASTAFGLLSALPDDAP